MAKTPVVAQKGLPYNTELQKKAGIDSQLWHTLTTTVWPGAKTTTGVLMAYNYCKARGLDPLKKPVHIVQVWDSSANDGKGAMVENIWPGIQELRTTAHRTGIYAGNDPVEFGEIKTMEYQDYDGNTVSLEYPEWAKMTVYRMVNGQRVPFHGPKTFWMESYASRRGGAPNSMWQKRPHGQLEKCAEAAALRKAFPEELDGEYTAEEMAGQTINHDGTMERRISEKSQVDQFNDMVSQDSNTDNDGDSQAKADQSEPDDDVVDAEFEEAEPDDDVDASKESANDFENRVDI